MSTPVDQAQTGREGRWSEPSAHFTGGRVERCSSRGWLRLLVARHLAGSPLCLWIIPSTGFDRAAVLRGYVRCKSIRGETAHRDGLCSSARSFFALTRCHTLSSGRSRASKREGRSDGSTARSVTMYAADFYPPVDPGETVPSRSDGSARPSPARGRRQPRMTNDQRGGSLLLP